MRLPGSTGERGSPYSILTSRPSKPLVVHCKTKHRLLTTTYHDQHSVLRMITQVAEGQGESRRTMSILRRSPTMSWRLTGLCSSLQPWEYSAHVMLRGSGVVSLCFVERMSRMYPVKSTSLNTVIFFQYTTSLWSHLQRGINPEGRTALGGANPPMDGTRDGPSPISLAFQQCVTPTARRVWCSPSAMATCIRASSHLLLTI